MGEQTLTIGCHTIQRAEIDALAAEALKAKSATAQARAHGHDQGTLQPSFCEQGKCSRSEGSRASCPGENVASSHSAPL